MSMTVCKALVLVDSGVPSYRRCNSCWVRWKERSTHIKLRYNDTTPLEKVQLIKFAPHKYINKTAYSQSNKPNVVRTVRNGSRVLRSIHRAIRVLWLLVSCHLAKAISYGSPPDSGLNMKCMVTKASWHIFHTGPLTSFEAHGPQTHWKLPLAAPWSLCPSDPANSQGDAGASRHLPVSWFAPGLPPTPWQMVLGQQIQNSLSQWGSLKNAFSILLPVSIIVEETLVRVSNTKTSLPLWIVHVMVQLL